MSLFLSAILACTINTGLDPACPATSAGVGTTQQTISPIATERGTAVFAQRQWNDRDEFRIDLPIHDHLAIDGLGSSSGPGDLALRFTKRLKADHQRFDETAGASLTLPTGSDTFTAGRTYLDPSYSMSYHATRSVSVIGLADYTFPVGGSRVSYAPNLQAFNVRSRALLVTRSGLYGALDAGIASVHGDQRYTAYDGRITAGALFARRYNVSFWYDQPFSQFTKDYIFERGLGFSLSIQ